MDSIKRRILNQLLTMIDARIENFREAIQSAKESRDSETKSSVGDKYETGRTLMQLEVEKNRAQLNKTERLKTELSKIDVQKVFDKVEFGSLVKTTQNNYFISTALGKIDYDNTSYFCISLASPIGKVLHKKQIGDTFTFQGKEVKITSIE